MERMLSEVDVFGEDDLRALGVIDAYRRLKFRFGRRVSITALYAMEAALTDYDWRGLDPAVKARLRSAVE
jgi:DNA transformation protein